MLKPFNLEEAKAGKPIVCRDGSPAKFIAYVPEAAGHHQVIWLGSGNTIYHSWANGLRHGHGNADSCFDLLMAPEKLTAWINFYPGNLEYRSKESADRCASPSRIACVEVTYEEGQGL